MIDGDYSPLLRSLLSSGCATQQGSPGWAPGGLWCGSVRCHPRCPSRRPTAGSAGPTRPPSPGPGLPAPAAGCGLRASWKVRKPVPAGTRWPRITFSFRPDQVVDLAGQGRFGEHLGGFLEAGGRDEAGALHGRLGDAQQLGAGGGHLRLDALGRLAAEGLDLGVDLFERVLRAQWRPGSKSLSPFSAIFTHLASSWLAARNSNFTFFYNETPP